MKPVLVPFFIPHLGCPHRCIFCDQVKIAGARSVLPDPAELRGRIAEYRSAAPGRALEVAFYGGTFTALPIEDQRRLLEPLQPLIACREVQSVRLSTRPDAIDPGTVSFLLSMGVTTVELGVQSMDGQVLTRSRRGHTAADVERAVSLLAEGGVSVGIQLMPGLPGDSEERSLASLRRVLALSPSFLRIYPALVIDGTELADLYLRGEYRPLSLDEAVSVSKKMLTAARKAGVPVVRMGLQPTAELEAPGVILAGPYHPAFRQLVEGELMYDRACELAAGLPAGSEVTFAVSRGKVSDLVGQRRLNVKRLTERFGIRVAGVREDDALAEGEVSLTARESERM
ncbi:radical SAM protein [Geomonas sp. Red32]|uniref:elongator complex protein 3 n=1 Tax=Geomonas sp. Red32 TaxID=2912856 RepID=UPI00202CE05A|nr:radical SAM protein [Geomonas sp. Red32]MCM0084343.1 radical SAM protein [Geomonas sp. Red32]